MYWETLPIWFWGIYYSFLTIIFITAVVRLARKKKFIIEILVLFFVFAIPIVGFLFSFDSNRPIEQNEFEFFLAQLQTGAAWTIFSVAGYCMLLGWWIKVLTEKRRSMV
ncbi:hypothetical protein [Jeotgalibacillus alimentarius]|uniref:hypothetical protein n=1 Tax=Jeotgalibacillus alimentarius TaxID=135826 RepID=UPI000597D427|nr:hypothetical protein [Jeotgalibacillus alimentarius]